MSSSGPKADGPNKSPGKRAASLKPLDWNFRDTTPVPTLSAKAKGPENTPELTSIFEADLTNIKSLVTCSICDQLLYEPWTLSCGHTYCYSCLCSWFIPNKRKKTCPECRTKVKQIPAPSFLVKQLVEIFTKRSELLPSDETVAQHTQRRAEEIAEVEKDRNGPVGLFKGTFPSRAGELYRDEMDGGVMRCRECGVEHEGGPACRNCGAELDEDDYGFSDMEDDADFDGLDALSLEMDDDIDLDLVDENYFGFRHAHYPPWRHGHINVHHVDLDGTDGTDSEDSEDPGSLEDFVEDDEEPIRGPGRSNARASQAVAIEISDDESDEGGAISRHIPRQRTRNLRSSVPSSPSVTSNTDGATDVSDTNSETDRLRRSGWSPLDQGPDSDLEDQFQFRTGYEYTEDEQASDENSDTETIGGNGPSDDDENDTSRDSLSPTPTYTGGDGYIPFIPHEQIAMPNDYSSASGVDDDSRPRDYSPVSTVSSNRYSSMNEADDDSVPREFSPLSPPYLPNFSSSVRDRDGDTEMSVSPRASRDVSVSYDTDEPNSTSNYPESRSSRSMSRSNYENAPETNSHVAQSLGVANEIVEIDDDSDTPIRPVRRRNIRNRRQSPNERARQYDPRISMIFAEHQQSLRSEPEQADLEELDNEIRRVEPGPRIRRMTAYRHQPSRRNDPLRMTPSPSATRVIASSSRVSRPPRNYAFGRG